MPNRRVTLGLPTLLINLFIIFDTLFPCLLEKSLYPWPQPFLIFFLIALIVLFKWHLLKSPVPKDVVLHPLFPSALHHTFSLEIWPTSTALPERLQWDSCLILLLFLPIVFCETLPLSRILFHLHLTLFSVGSEAISYFPSEAHC